MGEDDFRVSLEFRLCHEFAGLPERRYHYFWCDGFVPSVEGDLLTLVDPGGVGLVYRAEK